MNESLTRRFLFVLFLRSEGWLFSRSVLRTSANSAFSWILLAAAGLSYVSWASSSARSRSATGRRR
jgi:hypothetical protein